MAKIVSIVFKFLTVSLFLVLALVLLAIIVVVWQY